MTNKPISDFDSASSVNGADLVPVVQSGANKKSTLTMVATFLASLTQTFTGKTINGANNTLTVRLGSDVTGNLPINNLASGTGASSTTYLRGDNVWAVPPGGGGGGGAVDSVNGQTGVVVLDQSDIGLDQVNNTSDANKPVSTLQAAADATVQAYSIQRSHHTGSQTASTISDFSTASDARITAQKAQNSGLASLDSGGKVPTSQLPSSVVGALNYQGTWNATTNTPTIVSATGTKGFYYVVATAGTTTIDGENDWKIKDWITFNGTAWEKVDNTETVTSVNGATGAVVLTTTNVSEGTSLYFTAARAIASAITGFSAAAGTVAATDTIVQAFNKIVGNIAALTTTAITEGTNLYYTAARVITAPITGFSASAGVVAATDTILQAINKIVGNMGLLATKNTTTTVGTSRSLTSADNGNTLELTAATLSITVPTGLGPNFGCVIIPNGTTSLVSSGGTLLNGATTTLTRSSSVNAAFAILPRSATDSYVVNGI